MAREVLGEEERKQVKQATQVKGVLGWAFSQNIIASGNQTNLPENNLPSHVHIYYCVPG